MALAVAKGESRSPLKAAVLIIGSLWWRGAARQRWRAARLNIEQARHVHVAIRYGRLSNSKTYTMVFTKEAPPLGVGIAVPFQREVNCLDDLLEEARQLWQAEVNDTTETRLWRPWGSVALGIGPGQHLPAEWHAGWRARFGSQLESIPLVDRGFLAVPWPSPVSGPPLDADLLLATVNRPSDRLPTPGEMADAWVDHQHEDYFLENVRHGITTPDDEAIWRRLRRRGPEWLTKTEYREAVSTLRRLYPTGLRRIWRRLARRLATVRERLLAALTARVGELFRGWRAMGHTITFEFGETEAAKAFWARNAAFWPSFQRLMTLTNKCFGRHWKPRNRMQDIVFNLGETCRQDFLEILFLAVNGHGIGAQKLLRGLYERAVTLEYIRQSPEKAERFVRFAAIQEFKAARKALEVITPEQFDAEMSRAGTSFAKMKQLHDEVKPEFQVTHCKRCGTTETAFGWDIDMASMVNRLGEPYKQLFLSCYTVPTLQIHATLASAFSREGVENREERNMHDAEFSLISATLVFVAVLQSQSEVFSLKLDDEIKACWEDVTRVWTDRPHGPLAKNGGAVS
jgi:hypothetical protein